MMKNTSPHHFFNNPNVAPNSKEGFILHCLTPIEKRFPYHSDVDYFKVTEYLKLGWDKLKNESIHNKQAAAARIIMLAHKIAMDEFYDYPTLEKFKNTIAYTNVDSGKIEYTKYDPHNSKKTHDRHYVHKVILEHAYKLYYDLFPQVQFKDCEQYDLKYAFDFYNHSTLSRLFWLWQTISQCLYTAVWQQAKDGDSEQKNNSLPQIYKGIYIRDEALEIINTYEIMLILC